MRRHKMLRMAPLFLLGALLFIALGGLLVRELWNAVVPAIFGWPQVTFWQALGLLALCRILFGGLGLHGGSARSNIGRRMAAHWEAMTPEERERVRQGMRGRWGVPPASEGENPAQ